MSSDALRPTPTAAYPALKARWLSLAFILGPSLTAASAALFISGVALNPGLMSWGSPVEGVIGLFGYILLIPCFLALADELGPSMPRTAVATRGMVLLGFGGGAVWNMGWRVLIADEIAAGVDTAALDQLMTNMMEGRVSAALFAITLIGVFTWISSLILGIGLWRRRGMQREGALLVAAGILFPLGQLFQLGEGFYVAAIFIWAAALIPIGVRRPEFLGHRYAPA